MPLTQGQFCPEIQVHDIENQPLSLQLMRGTPVLLSFLREVNCGFCNRRIRELKEGADALREQGLQVIAIIAGSEETVREYAEREQLRFRIIADPGGSLHQRFGLRRSTSGVFRAMTRVRTVAELAAQGELGMSTVLGEPLLPGDFVLHNDGTIARAHYGADLGDHLPLSKVSEWLTHFAC